MIPKSATTTLRRRGDSVVVFFHLLLPFRCSGKEEDPSSLVPRRRRRHQNHQTSSSSSSSSEKYSSRGVPSFAAVNDDANARDEDFLHTLGVKLRKETGREAQMPPGRVGLFGVRETLEYLMDSNAFVETRVKKVRTDFQDGFFLQTDDRVRVERSRG